MIRRVQSPTGVVYYASTLLRDIGVPHAFSTRVGGVSEGVFASLNLGNPNGAPVQDPVERIDENYRRLQEAIGCADRRRVYAHQVHGAEVIRVGTDLPSGTCELGRADALATDDPATLLSIRVADCVPVLLADRSGKRVAAVHAGWRGVVVGAALEALKYFDQPEEVAVAIGPSISIDAFEIGEEVLDQFRRQFGEQTPFRNSPRGTPGKYHIDLRESLKIQLLRAGVPASRIDITDRCTVRDRDEFFSHRRDNGVTGRMAGIIGARG